MARGGGRGDGTAAALQLGVCGKGGGVARGSPPGGVAQVVEVEGEERGAARVCNGQPYVCRTPPPFIGGGGKGGAPQKPS